MFPNVESAPQLDYESIGADHKVFDLVYNPAQTEFLRRAKEQGASTMGGMLMLQTQAIASWHIWQGPKQEQN
jgi:shikimate dehydrogenase